MAIPILAVGVVGVYLYKKYRDREYDNLKHERDDLEKEKNSYESDNNKKFHIKSLPFIVASLYSIANIDGEIDDSEENFIQNEINKMLETIEDEKLKENIIKALKEIEQNKLSIKLSDAIDYITFENEDFVKRNLRDYNRLLSNLSVVDNKQDDRERELLERFEIIWDKGRDAKKEIIELENQDLLPNFYYASSECNKSLTPSTEIIMQNDSRFINISELQFDKYYVKHPMNPQKLFDLQHLDRIEELQISELSILSNKLGAKSFSCTVESEKKETSNKNSGFDTNFGYKNTSFDFNFENNLTHEEYQSKFEQYNWTAEGKCTRENKETLTSDLLWLKHDNKAKAMIEAMKGNKLKTYNFEISFKKFKDENSNFNLSAHLSLLGKIDNELKRCVESNIQKSLNHTLKISIEF